MTPTPFYVRSLGGAINLDDEHGTADVLVVPYNTPTPIVEFQPGRGRVSYTESILPGAAERAVRGGAGRTPFTYNHSDAFGDRMGVVTSFRDDPEVGLFASMRFDPSKMDAVRDAITSSHQGISMAFLSRVPKPFTEREGSLVERRSIVILHIAAVPAGAYDDARVLAVRNLADDQEEDTPADVAAREEVAERERVIREALELVDAGARWASFRSEGA